MLSLVCGTHSQPSADDGYSCFTTVAATAAVISQYWCFDNSTEDVKEKSKQGGSAIDLLCELGQVAYLLEAVFSLFCKRGLTISESTRPTRML